MMQAMRRRPSKARSRRKCALLSLLLVSFHNLIFYVSAASNQTNKARLQLLQTREELLEEVFESARSKTSGAAGKGKKYNELLQALVLQVRPLLTVLCA